MPNLADILLQGYVANYQRYAQRHGEPTLEGLARRRSRRLNVGDTADAAPISGPVGLVTNPNATSSLSSVIGTTRTGPRADRARQEFDLGDGRFAHVYYTPTGKRQVFVFRRAAA